VNHALSVDIHTRNSILYQKSLEIQFHPYRYAPTAVMPDLVSSDPAQVAASPAASRSVIDGVSEAAAAA
jgi:hypothetical protein